MRLRVEILQAPVDRHEHQGIAPSMTESNQDTLPWLKILNQLLLVVLSNQSLAFPPRNTS